MDKGGIIVNKTNLIFLHKFFKAIANSIIQVFIPLYILKVTGSLMLAMGYLTIYTCFVMFFIFILRKFIQKFGVLAIMLHFIPIIVTEALISFCTIDFGVVFLCALFMGISQGLYSVPINLIFAFSDKHTNVAKFQIPSNIGKLSFVLISGFVLSSTIENNFLIMSVLSIVFYVLSVIPIMYAYKMLKEHYQEKVQLAHQPIKTPLYKKFKWFHVGFGSFQACMDNCIPLYLYVNNLSFQAVTIVIALIELLKIFANYFAKYLVGKGKQKLCCMIGCVVYFVSLLGLMLFRIPELLYVFSCLSAVSFPLTFVPMFKMYCNYLSSTNNVFDGLVYRDLDIFSVRPIMYALAFVGVGLWPCLVVGLVSTVSMMASEICVIKQKSTEDNMRKDIVLKGESK